MSGRKLSGGDWTLIAFVLAFFLIVIIVAVVIPSNSQKEKRKARSLKTEELPISVSHLSIQTPERYNPTIKVQGNYILYSGTTLRGGEGGREVLTRAESLSECLASCDRSYDCIGVEFDPNSKECSLKKTFASSSSFFLRTSSGTIKSFSGKSFGRGKTNEAGFGDVRAALRNCQDDPSCFGVEINKERNFFTSYAFVPEEERKGTTLALKR